MRRNRPQNSHGPREKWLPGALFLLTAIFFLNFSSRVMMAPLMPRVELDLGLSHAQAGSLFLLMSMGYFISILGSGLVAARLRHRGTIMASALTMALALLALSCSAGLMGLSVGLFAMGMAAGLYLPSGLATLTSLVKPDHWGRAVAVHELAPNVGFVVTPLVAMGLLEVFSWRGVLACLGLASLAGGLGFWRWGKGGEALGQAPDLASLRALTSLPAFWVMMVCFSLALGASLGIYNMLPLFLINQHGYEPHRADLLVAASRISGVGMAFLAGWASDRLGPRLAMSWVLGLSGLLTLCLGLAQGGLVVALLFLQPAVSVCFFPPGFAALARLGPQAARGNAVSLTVPLAFLMGGGGLPALIGYLGERVSFGVGIALAGGLMLIGPLLLRRLALADPPS